MKSRFSLLIFFVLLLQRSVFAQTLVMEPLVPDHTLVPELINAHHKSDNKDWPATFKFSPNGKRMCTSTAVGPHVLLTAAHCIFDGQEGIVKIANAEMRLTCYQATLYNNDSADWGLCAVYPEKIPAVRFETINTAPLGIKTGRKILLTGLGCTKENGTDRSFGVQYEGEAPITPIKDFSGKDVTWPDGLPKVENAPWARYFMSTHGGPAICYGDSGGAAYIFLDAAKQRRRIVGVNSQGNYYTDSYLAATFVKEFVDWANEWANSGWKRRWSDGGKNGNMTIDDVKLDICGLNTQNRFCRP